jgi:hypothetical protein
MTTNQEQLTSEVVTPTAEKIALKKRRKWLNWKVWALLIVAISGSVGFTATSLLLRLPKTPNCPRIFWPVASASMRLYCAQLEAETGKVDNLLKAIALVEALPKEHPLRAEINRNVEQWSIEILNIAEEQFQTGEIEDAIATAEKIPHHVYAYNLVEERISRWRSIWAEGEEIFADVEEQLRKSNWNQAFRLAVQLLNLDNKYWATIKYDETIANIQLAQEESKQLDGAYAILRRGGIDNWMNAIAEAQKINASSYAYQEAQNLISTAKDKLLSYVEKLIDNENWSDLQYVVEKLPDNIALNDKIEDWKALAQAGIDSQFGTTDSLKAAILSAQTIKSDSEVYTKAQNLINRWHQESADVAILTQARETARSGTIDDLSQAIAEAEQIQRFNPRYREARQEIRDWNRQIQVIEDQPILDSARTIARRGDIASLQQAISQASVISSGRALSSEAQAQINRWRSSIQRQEDQPFLDQAITLANVRDYQAAINSASQIRRGRVLYGEAQEKIRSWRREIKAQQDFQEAYTIAEGKTPEALVTAIGIVKRIPDATDVGSQSRQALDRWSFQLLSLATDKANQSKLEEAIRLAKIIPSESTAYRSAQAQIKIWQKILEPTPEAVPSPNDSNRLMETNYSNPTTSTP